MRKESFKLIFLCRQLVFEFVLWCLLLADLGFGCAQCFEIIYKILKFNEQKSKRQQSYCLQNRYENASELPLNSGGVASVRNEC